MQMADQTIVAIGRLMQPHHSRLHMRPKSRVGELLEVNLEVRPAICLQPRWRPACEVEILPRAIMSPVCLFLSPLPSSLTSICYFLLSFIPTRHLNAPLCTLLLRQEPCHSCQPRKDAIHRR